MHKFPMNYDEDSRSMYCVIERSEKYDTNSIKLIYDTGISLYSDNKMLVFTFVLYMNNELIHQQSVDTLVHLTEEELFQASTIWEIDIDIYLVYNVQMKLIELYNTYKCPAFIEIDEE